MKGRELGMLGKFRSDAMLARTCAERAAMEIQGESSSRTNLKCSDLVDFQVLHNFQNISKHGQYLTSIIHAAPMMSHAQLGVFYLETSIITSEEWAW